MADSGIVVIRADMGKINFITPSRQFNIGYAHETKRKNKWVIGLRGTMNFIKPYTIDYEILNPDKSYSTEFLKGDTEFHKGFELEIKIIPKESQFSVVFVQEF